MKPILNYKDSYNMHVINSHQFAVADPMVLVIRALANNDTVTIPTANGYGTFAGTINWGDGNILPYSSYNDANLTHTYATSGDYTVSINGKFGNINVNNTGTLRTRLVKILKMGGGDTKFFSFDGCTILDQIFDDGQKNGKSLTFANLMFRNITTITNWGDIVNLDISNLTSLWGMFLGNPTFNEDITGWDISKIKVLKSMLQNCKAFNRNLNSWDFSNVEDMYLFLGNYNPESATFAFNNGGVPINWNLSSCIDARAIFYVHKSLNVPITLTLSTDPSKNVLLSAFLYRSNVFNSQLSFNSTERVTNVDNMFNGCTAYNRSDPASFNVAKVTTFVNFMAGCNLSPANYDAILTSWDAQELVNNLAVHFGSSKYTATGQTAKNNIIATDNWTFTDGGLQ